MKKALLGAALMLPMPLFANLYVCEGPAGCTLQGAGIENILLNDNDIGNPITGTTNQTGTLVDFTSGTDILITQGNGQSELRAQDGVINELTFYAQDTGLGFEHVVFNIGAAADTIISLSAVDNFGTLFDFGDFVADGSGQNFFTIGSDDIQYARTVSIAGDGINALTELQQIRVNPDLIPDCPDCGPDPQSVSSPGHLALLSLGLLGLLQARRRK